MSLPRGWARVCLGDVCQRVEKWDPRKSPGTEFDYVDIGAIDGQRVTRSTRLLGADAPSRARQLVRGGDTILSTVRTYLVNTALVPEELDGATVSTGFCVLRPTTAIDPKFLFYRVIEPAFVAELSEAQTGSSYPAVRDTDVFARPVGLPPLAEQRRIAAAIEEQLSRLDAGSAALISTARRLAQLRSVVLEKAFALNAPDVPLGSVAMVGSGATPKRGRAEYWEGGSIPWVTSGQLNKSHVREPAELITEQALRETNVKLWPPGTLLIALYGEGKTRGRCAELMIEATTNQACAALVLDEAAADRTYVRRFFDANYVANRRLAAGGVQPNLSLGLIRALRIPLPPLDEQQRVAAEIEQRLSVIAAMEDAIRASAGRCAALQRSILATAFRGELVPQNSGDEPASVLLDRIAVDLAAAPKSAQKRERAKA